MKITLDHNCIISLAKNESSSTKIREIISAKENQCFVVNMGASEMQKYGVRPDRYDRFEYLLAEAGLESLPRLNPLAIFDVTFFNRCMLAGEEMIFLARKIENILFAESKLIDIANLPEDHRDRRVWLNRTCDIHTMWCHIYYGNELFLTADKNFAKPDKAERLYELGAGRICSPDAFYLPT